MTIRSKTDDVAFAAADEEIIAAIGLDPDARLLTREDFRRMRHTPRVKLIRRALRLDREGFAIRYGIPLDVIEDWESRKTLPD